MHINILYGDNKTIIHLQFMLSDHVHGDIIGEIVKLDEHMIPALDVMRLSHSGHETESDKQKAYHWCLHGLSVLYLHVLFCQRSLSDQNGIWLLVGYSWE